MGKSKLNPDLMIGDEIVVVSTEGIHDFGAPELFKPYVVVGIKHGTTMNREIHKWTHDEDEEQTPDRSQYPPELQARSRLGFRKEFDTIPYTYYQIEPIGMTDEERTGAMLAGGGRIKPMYIFPSPSEYRGSDQWILRPGFLRGEHLTEHKESRLNPELEVGDEILVVDNSGTARVNLPELYLPYVVEFVHKPNKYQPSDAQSYYSLDLLAPPDLETAVAQGIRIKDLKLYQQHRWIFRPGFRRGELNESKKNFDSIPPLDTLEYGERLNPKPNVGDKIILIDKEEALQAYESNQPELFTPYVVISKHDYNFQLVKVDEYDYWKGWVERGSDEVPSPQKIFYPLDYKWMDADTPTDTNVDRLTMSEQIETELNPELERDDVIRIVDIDRERESGETMYTTPSPELRPEMLRPYSVVEKESAGHKSKWPFKYTIVPEGEIEITGRNPYGEENTNVKLLYPWIYQWIYAHKKTITEHEETGLSPELEEGDIIRVIEVDGEHSNMPEKWGIYKVHDILGRGGTQPVYYQLSGETSELIQDRLMNAKYLYREDIWIYDEVDRKTLSEHNQPGLSPDLEVDDIIRVIDVDGEHARMPERWGVYKVKNIKQDNSTQEFYYDIVSYPEPELPDSDYMRDHKETWGHPNRKTLYRGDTWIPADIPMATGVDRLTISEHKQEFNQPLTMGDVIRVVDVDKEATYEQPKYPYDTGNDSGNSLMTNHYRGQIHGQDTYPYPMRLYAVMSKSLYRTQDRDYLNPYWMLWPVDKDGKVEAIKDFHEIILTDKDTWMTIKKHHSNIPGDIEAKHKEYVDSGRDIISRVLDEQDGEEGRIEDETDFGDGKPFTTLEVRILNTLHKYLDRSDLQSLSEETPPEYGELGKKFWDVMKIFGITSVNTEQDTRTSKYAKWALDNWTEEGDYGNIENPIKEPLKWYQVDREESGSQVEYKDGTTEVLGFDEDDAGQRGDYNFWDWGGEMETNDYGDYETYDSEIVGTEFLRMDEGLARVLREDMGKQKIQDLLFNYWRKFGPTLDPDKLKLLGFDMHSEEDKILVYNNLIEYYGDEELENVVHERLEGVHDADYEFIVTSYDSLTPRTYKSEARGLETYVDVLINGDQIIPISQEDGTVRDMTVWEANEKAAEEQQENPYDDAYEGIREEIQYYLNDVILQNLPIEAYLDYVDFSEPGTFEAYAQESLSKSSIEMIREDDGYIDDMVYIDEPREKHIRRMGRGLGSLVGFPLDKYKNMPPPENESDTTEEEIEYLEEIPVDKNLVDSADEIRQHFKNFLSPKGLEYPKEEMKEVMQGVKAIILILKYYYNRPRPWQIADAKGLELNSETLQSSSSPSYPSGHATQGRFVALYLSDLYPEYRDELMQIGDDIAFSRNMAKVHYPSDSAFGKLLGDDMYDHVNQPQLEPEMIHETIMDDIPLEQFREDNPEVVEILDRFPETLQRELAVERKNPQEFVEDFGNYYLNSEKPIPIKLSGELNKEHTIDTMSRTPQDVVDVINKRWGTEFEVKKVFDPNPARYFEYAKFPGSTAKPSLMVNGEILYGVARFIAALLRGDETMEVWDITRKENLKEQVMMKKGDMLKSDIITFLTNRFILDSTEYSELKDNKGNYYRIIDMKDPYEPVTLSDLIEPTVEFVSSGIKSGDFEEEDMNTALTVITNWISLEMNQKKELVN